MINQFLGGRTGWSTALTVLEMRKELGIEGKGRPKKMANFGHFSVGSIKEKVAREWHVSHSYVQLAKERLYFPQIWS